MTSCFYKIPISSLSIINRSCVCRFTHQQSSSRRVVKNETYKIRQYLLSYITRFVKGYENVLEKRFPSAMHVYRIFMVGSKDFYKDIKAFVKIFRFVHSTPKGIHSLSHQEMKLYFMMRKDIRKVSPVLMLSALPFTNYIVFPLMYLFPRQLLCSHFWTLQQRVEFALASHRSRLYNNRPVFRALQAQLDNIEEHPLHKPWMNVLSLIGSGVHPNPEQIIECIDLFRDFPYHILHLYPGHVKALLRMHSMHIGWRRRTRLTQRAQILHTMDLAIVRGGGPETLSFEDLRWACFFRGLNPVNVKNEDLTLWLNQWILVSKAVDSSSLSLLLHCPILLAYNYPSNWSLIH